MAKLPIYVILHFTYVKYINMPYNNFFLVVALKPRMNTDIYIYIYIYIYICCFF